MTKNYLSSDRPIESAGEDRLGFQPFASSLAKGMHGMVPADGMVIALHAPWGSGKTSAFNLIARHLTVLDLAELTREPIEELSQLAAARPDGPEPEEQERATRWGNLLQRHQQSLRTMVVRFNPWYFSGQESVFKAFFGVLGTELSIDNETAVAKAVAAVLKRGAQAGSALEAVLGGLAAGPAGTAAATAVTGLFGTLAGDQFDTLQSLDSTLARLRDALRASEKHIIVFIDDIDRLMPAELRQMLTLLKSLGNLPRITYVLAYDRDEVGKLLEHAEISNSDYVEKIVQVSFDLPKIDRYALRSLLFGRLDAILMDGDIGDKERWGLSYHSYMDPYISRPRHVMQLSNALHVIWPSAQDEVDWTDLCILQVIRLHEPNIFKIIVDNLDRLTGEDQFIHDDKEWAKALQPTNENSSRPEIARDALAHLFPRLAKAWQTSWFGSRNEHELNRARRLCSSAYAQNYFSLSPSPDQFSSTQIQSLFSADDPGQAFASLLEQAQYRKTRRGNTMLSRLLEQMMEEVSSGTAMPMSLARSLLASTNVVLRTQDAEGVFYSVDNGLRMTWRFVNALRKMAPADRSDYLRSSFDGTKGVAFLVPFIETMTGKDSQDSTEDLIPPSDHAQLRTDALALVTRASAEPDFLKLPRCGRLLWAWVRLSNEETVSAWLTLQLANDAAIVELAELMTSEGISSSEGRYFYFDEGSWGKLINIDEFLARYDAIAVSRRNEQAAATTIAKFDEARTRGSGH